MYDATVLTPRKVARQSGYVDWASQPSIFKHYPDFLYRIPFGTHPSLRVAELARCVTETLMVGGRPYKRLSPPSAGNLHPIELYVQIRGVKGVLSGIYHIDADRDAFVLISEIASEGIEHAFGYTHRFDGLLFVISAVPYRSEWKYGERAVRYCFMDAGHQIGALKAAAAVCADAPITLKSFDAAGLNRLMGFSSQEFAIAACAMGTPTERKVAAVKPLIRVAPTDYDATEGYVPGMVYKAGGSVFALPRSSEKMTETVILSRRSARKFGDMPCGQCEPVRAFLTKPPEELTAHIVHVTGDNGDRLSKMLVDQAFIKRAAFVAVLTSETFGSDTLMQAGAFAHAAHLEAHAHDVGFTGIGAFYESQWQAYLGTDAYILYVVAVGAAA